MACSWLIHIEVKSFTFRLYIITWALLGYVREIAVAYDFGIRIRILQVLKQVPKGCFLLGSASVGIAAFLVYSTDVADANGMVVVVLYVGTGILLVAALVDAAVLIDYPVIANHCPVLGFVAAVYVFDRPFLIGFRT